MSKDEQDYLWEQLEEMWPTDSKVKQSLSEEIEEFERKRITMALDLSNGNKTHASKELGIGRTLLIHKCKKYRLYA